MINREIVYERNLTGSYMKIPAGIRAGLDERLMLRRKIPGALPVEKAYVDGNGQYWYNISGKQSLDVYCRVKPVGIDLIERLIVSICSEMEILEWNLIHTSCLCLDPELIFVTNSNQEFIFTIYPDGAGGIEKEFEQLMEYLLTKIDHKDTQAVRAAYSIYEQSLKEGYSIMDLRSKIMEAKKEEAVSQQIKQKGYEDISEYGTSPYPASQPLTPDGWGENKTRLEQQSPEPSARVKPVMEKRKKGDWKPENQANSAGRRKQVTGKKDKSEKESRKINWMDRIREKLTDWGILEPEPIKKKQEEVLPVYPEEVYAEPEPVIHPTICLSSYAGKARGVFLYQGSDKLDDIRVEGNSLRIGYGKDADIRIDRDTVSNLHARIDREGDAYYIEDLNSTNGTFVNDEPLAYKERRKLESNDSVRFADIRYRFV